VTSALRNDEAKWTLRRGIRFLPVTISRRHIDGLIGDKTTENRTGTVRRRACRHTEPDARHDGLDGKGISDQNGQ
jgi:hypothetical protein